MKKDKISIKDFVKFSLFIFPLTLLVFLKSDLIINFLMGSKILFYILFYIILSVVDWVYGQKHIRNYLVIGSTAISLFVAYYWAIVPTQANFILSILGTIVIFSVMFIFFSSIQFWSWVPFLIKYLYVNRKNLNNLK